MYFGASLFFGFGFFEGDVLFTFFKFILDETPAEVRGASCGMGGATASGDTSRQSLP